MEGAQQRQREGETWGRRGERERGEEGERRKMKILHLNQETKTKIRKIQKCVLRDRQRGIQKCTPTKSPTRKIDNSI